MYQDFELKIIHCLKNSNSPSWIKLLKDPETNLFYFMGNGGQGTSIISKMKPKFSNIIKELIDSRKLVEDEKHYSIEYKKTFTVYTFFE